MRSSQLAIFLSLFSLPSTLAALVNITIDDKFGDPVTGALITYAPAESWNDGGSCVPCNARPDASQTYMASWHDGTYNPLNGSNSTPGTILSASIPFTGTAVYVYCIIANAFSSPNGNSDMTFLIDGKPVGSFARTPTGSPTYDYNVLVYQNTSLPSGAHTLSIESGHGGKMALMMLDRVVYSHEIGKRSNTTIMVGTTVGPIVLILVVLASIFLTRCYMKGRSSKPYPLDLSTQVTYSLPTSTRYERWSTIQAQPSPPPPYHFSRVTSAGGQYFHNSTSPPHTARTTSTISPFLAAHHSQSSHGGRDYSTSHKSQMRREEIQLTIQSPAVYAHHHHVSPS